MNAVPHAVSALMRKKRWYLTGSSVVEGVVASDTDIVFYAPPEEMSEFKFALHQDGFVQKGFVNTYEDTLPEQNMHVFYKDKVDVILIHNKEFYNKHVDATNELRAHPTKYQNKEQRVKLFKKYLYGVEG